MLLKKQRNALFEILQVYGITPTSLDESRQEESYELSTHLDEDEYYFYLEKQIGGYEVVMRPGLNGGSSTEIYPNTWEELIDHFATWAGKLREELDTPDRWAEATKNAQLFAPTAEPSDDKFTRTELAQVHGQLRLLQLSFEAAALPEAARQKLIELTETAAVKAEGFTKKDWQSWFIGSIVSRVTDAALDAVQIQLVYHMVKTVFNGLFLN